MTGRGGDPIKAVERRIGYEFKNGSHLIAALTHATAANGRPGEDYQRLEFLGDRVLGLVVADMLLREFPEADEGELNRRFVSLVRKETCADVAASLRLGAALIVGGGDAQRTALRTRNVLGDICESVIAAIYLDGGFDAARAFVERNWHELMLTRASGRRSAKTELQEWAQRRGLPTPRYAILDRSGPDHDPVFVLEARIAGLPPARGEGASRRKAEEAAATEILMREGVWQAK